MNNKINISIVCKVHVNLIYYSYLLIYIFNIYYIYIQILWEILLYIVYSVKTIISLLCIVLFYISFIHNILCWNIYIAFYKAVIWNDCFFQSNLFVANAKILNINIIFIRTLINSYVLQLQKKVLLLILQFVLNLLYYRFIVVSLWKLIPLIFEMRRNVYYHRIIIFSFNNITETVLLFYSDSILTDIKMMRSSLLNGYFIKCIWL